MASEATPKGVGYWGQGLESGPPGLCLPRPQSLVRPGWRVEDRERIAEYLRCGRVFGAWCGRAHCRFENCDKALGSTDLTDREWIWPAGLEHYILEHSVALPDEFIDRMQKSDWIVPPAEPDEERFLLERLEGDRLLPFGDLSRWIEWARYALARA